MMGETRSRPLKKATLLASCSCASKKVALSSAPYRRTGVFVRGCSDPAYSVARRCAVLRLVSSQGYSWKRLYPASCDVGCGDN
jgi:hypothetical protein